MGMGLLSEISPQLQRSQAWVALQEPVKSQRPQRKDQRCSGAQTGTGEKARDCFAPGPFPTAPAQAVTP